MCFLTQSVYQFCRERQWMLKGGVWAVKGASERTGNRSPIWPTRETKRRKDAGYKPVIIGTNAAKDAISSRLLIESPGPGYMHFSTDWGVDDFAQLTAERLTPKKVQGRWYRIWAPIPDRANERLDLRVYAYAALVGMLQRGLKLNKRADEVGAVSGQPIVLAETDEAKRLEELKKVAPVVEQAAGPAKKKRRPPSRRMGMMQGL